MLTNLSTFAPGPTPAPVPAKYAPVPAPVPALPAKYAPAKNAPAKNAPARYAPSLYSNVKMLTNISPFARAFKPYKNQTTSPKVTKYLYFQAQYGFNDILSTILKLISYCNRYKRVLLVDLALSTYQINFADYFTLPNYKNIITDTNVIKDILKNITSIYPQALAPYFTQILNGTCKFQIKRDQGVFCQNIRLNKLPLENRFETLIIHSQGGKGNGFQLFKQMKLCSTLVKKCKDRHALMQKPYIAIQVRNTDYKSDYKALYYNNAALIHNFKSVFLATDDESVVTFFKSKQLVVYNFTTFNSAAKSENLHYNTSISGETKILDLMTDIYIVAMSQFMLSNSKGGFIDLVKNCFNNKAIVANIFKN